MAKKKHFSNVFPKLALSLHLSFLNVGWFTFPSYAFLALVIVFVWQYSGYLMIIYVAALQNVPHELIESAKIDGATSFQRLRLVILPLIRNSITIRIFLSISTAFKMYDFLLILSLPYQTWQLWARFGPCMICITAFPRTSL